MTNAPDPPADFDPSPTSFPPPSGRRGWAIALQLLGFLVGMGLLGACAYLALSNPKYREQIARLAEAPWPNLLGLLALSAATIAISGLTFAAILRPVRKLSRLDCVAVNGVCSMLSYLPFKMSLVFRVYFHHRRDGLAVMVISGWIGATGLAILAGLGPVLLASLWRGKVDALWWMVAIGGMFVAGGTLVLVARFLSSPRGWRLLLLAAEGTRLRFARRAVESRWFANLHQGVHMLASPRAVGEALVLRTADITIQAARFYLAARTIDVALTPEQAVLAGVVYFFLQGTAPTGVAGAREAGTASVLALMQGENLVVVVLAVSAAEGTMNLVMGAAGAIWIRVDRLFMGRNVGLVPGAPGPA